MMEKRQGERDRQRLKKIQKKYNLLKNKNLFSLSSESSTD